MHELNDISGMSVQLDELTCIFIYFILSVQNILSELQLYRTASPFDRRCTAMEWHPRHISTLTVASKGGDIILWNHEKMKDEVFIQGVSN